MTKKLSNVQAATDHDITGAPHHAQRLTAHTALDSSHRHVDQRLLRRVADLFQLVCGDRRVQLRLGIARERLSSGIRRRRRLRRHLLQNRWCGIDRCNVLL